MGGKPAGKGETFPLEKLFPLHIRDGLCAVPWKEGLEEIRVRIGQPMEFCYGGESRYLKEQGGTCCFFARRKRREGAREEGQMLKRDAPAMPAYCPDGADIAEMLNYISDYSLYAYQEELRQGFITIQGGHRVGIAGGAVVEGRKIVGMHHITFLNIRAAHERLGCAQGLVPLLRQGVGIYNTLLLSAPGVGKTTLLRDSIRLLSEGTGDMPGLKVGVVDERSEIAACYRGIPQNDLGPRTDVLDGCPKAEGMAFLLRSMSPQVLAVDELGTEEDFLAVERAAYSGCSVLCTIHAGDIGEMREKPHLRRWLGKGLFGRYVSIGRDAMGERHYKVYSANMEQLC